MKVSIQIPVFSVTDFLCDAIESIYRQTYKDYEIIVIDDGAAADIPAILAPYPDVIYYRQEHKGVAAARNRAIELSGGEVIAFLDADDLWDESKLKKQTDYLKAHPECEIVFSGTENFTGLHREAMTDRQRQLFDTEISKYLGSSCVRRSVFENYGSYQESYEYGEDTELMARFAAAGVSMEHCLKDKLYFRRIHEDNMSLLHKNVGKTEYLKLLAAAFRKAKNSKEN